MCIKPEEIEALLHPLKKDIAEIRKSVAEIVTLQIKHVELEGQVIHLQKSDEVRAKSEDEMFIRLRKIETETKPRESCNKVFTNLDTMLLENKEAIKAIANTINNRTWAIVILLLGMAGSFWVTVIGGFIAYTLRKS